MTAAGDVTDGDANWRSRGLSAASCRLMQEAKIRGNTLVACPKPAFEQLEQGCASCLPFKTPQVQITASQQECVGFYSITPHPSRKTGLWISSRLRKTGNALGDFEKIHFTAPFFNCSMIVDKPSWVSHAGEFYALTCCSPASSPIRTFQFSRRDLLTGHIARTPGPKPCHLRQHMTTAHPSKKLKSP